MLRRFYLTVLNTGSFLLVASLLLNAGVTEARDDEGRSILVPAPISESKVESSWETSSTESFVIGNDIPVETRSTNERLGFAPEPEGYVIEGEPTGSTEGDWLTQWPLWSTSCSTCGSTHCSCQNPNHGIFGNLFDRRHGCWVGRFDALVLWRNAPQSRPLFTLGGGDALDANQLESDVLAAPRISLFHINKCGYGAEFTYIYAGNFYGQQNRTVDAYAAPGIYGNTSPDPTSASATLLGQLQSFEANSRTPVANGNIQFIAGFRWVQWQEELRIDTIPSPAYVNNCINDLYGGQIGFDTLLYRSNGGVRLEGLVKAGAYYNEAVQHSVAGPSQLSAFGSPASGAFVGEVGLTGVAPISRNWDVRVGYFGLWLESIAQPSRQLSGQRLPPADPPGASLSTIGGLVLQGVSLGIEGHW